MDLAILRHGRAGDRLEWAGDDRERPLTADGVARTEAVLRRLRILRRELRPDAIWTSPWTRAHQTAELAGRVWGLEPEIRTWLAGDTTGPELVAQQLEADAPPALMLVGHEPNLSELIGHLVGGPPQPLKKAGVALLTGPIGAGTMQLRATLTPKQILGD